ncbi:hypothetical protein HDU96_008616 [Phlyctochytrium bullatum]|nr:hypothetical protein HDU96_008616 [Phlyctochytrium bullatum]
MNIEENEAEKFLREGAVAECRCAERGDDGRSGGLHVWSAATALLPASTKHLPSITFPNRYNPGPVTWELHTIPFEQPLLFHHAVAALLHHGINRDIAEHIWPRLWLTERQISKIQHRVRALRAAVQKRFRRVEPKVDPESEEFEMLSFCDAIDLARTMELLFIGSAKLGYMEGLTLVPENHSLLDDLLSNAICSKHISAVRLLLEKGATVDSYALPMLDFTSSLDYELLELILNHGFDASKPFSETESLCSLVKGDPKFLQLLLKHGANPNTRDDKDYSALHHAVMMENCTCISLLLKAGADVNAIAGAGYTALALACDHRVMDAVEILIDAGANLNVTSDWPPLHAAVYRGAEDIVQVLLNAGALVNFADSKGNTPLHVAFTRLHRYRSGTDMLMMLLEAGADPTIRCNANHTPLYGFPLGFEWDSDLGTLFDRLMARGAHLNEVDRTGKTMWQRLRLAAQSDEALQQWISSREGGETVPEGRIGRSLAPTAARRACF